MALLSRKSARRVPARLQLETLEDRVVPATVTMPIVNLTGLPAQDSIYVVGYSATSKVELQSNGQFGAIPSGSGTIPSYNISTMPPITLNSSPNIAGGIFFFFVVPNDTPIPTFTYTNNGSNVNVPTSLANFILPNGIVEFTVAGGFDFDVSAVTAFSLPLTLTLNGQSVGQPVSGSAVNRETILSAYSNFMNSLNGVSSSVVQAYLSLVPTSANSVAGQASAILSPTEYLADSANSGTTSYTTLENIWNSDLTTLFETPGRTISMIGDNGDIYQGTPEQVGGQWVLHFVDYTDPTNGYVFNIYDPMTPDPYLGTSESAGQMVFGNDGVFADTSPMVIQTPTAPLSPPQPPPPPPHSPPPPPQPTITQQPAGQWQDAGGEVKYTAAAIGTPTPTVQWEVNEGNGVWTDAQSALLPPGVSVSGYNATTLTVDGVQSSMNSWEFKAVFTNTVKGVTYNTPTGAAGLEVLPVGTILPSTVVKGLERDIAAALNRGVATLAPSGGSVGTTGATSKYWGTETNWYPAGQTENLYSLFMHTATVNGTPIFTQPSNPGPVNDAQGTPMSQAYGFGFDESPGHGPAGQPNVPSEFQATAFSNGANTLTITLDPWGSLSPSPSPPPGPSPNPGPSTSSTATWFTTVLYMAEDQFAYLVDNMLSIVSNDPPFTQTADYLMQSLNDLLHLDNSALFTGLNGLKSAFFADPYYGTLWGYMAQAIGFDAAGGVFSTPT